MPGELPREIRQRVRRVGHYEDYGFRCGLDQTRHDIAINGSVGIQQPQSAARIAAIGGAASAFIDAGSDHNQVRAGQVWVVTFD
jgi:hypothetical protein